MRKAWSVPRIAFVGVVVGAAYGSFRALDYGLAWSGEGLAYNLGQLAGGVVGGLVAGALLAWLRNKLVSS